MNAPVDLRSVASRYGGRATSASQCSIPTPGHSAADLGTSLTLNESVPDGLLVHVHNGTDADALAIKDMLRRDGFLPERERRAEMPDQWRIPWSAGFSVIPVKRQGKLPAGSWKRFQTARAAFADVQNWAAQDINCGIVTGAVSGIFVLDLDSEAALAEAERRGLPTTVAARTANGHHLYFRHPGGMVKTCKGVPFEGADIRGDGGFVVGPGSVHPSGVVYEWEHSPADTAIAPAPRWLLDAIGAQRALLPLIDIEAWQGDAPPRRSLWGDWLPLHQTTMLTGPGGVGKSLFEQCLCTAISLGKPFLGMETEQRNTLYLTCEDEADELWRRQDAINAMFGIERRDLLGKLHLCSLTGEADTAIAVEQDDQTVMPTDRWHELVATCDAHEISLYAFDNATDAFAGDHNGIHQVAAFINLLTSLAIRRDGVAMLLHHPNKGGDDWLGSVAYHNKVRSRMIIDGPEPDSADPDARTIRNPKANYGPSGGKIAFRWHRGAFVRDEDLPADYAEELAKSIRAASENDVFLRCLRVRMAQSGREVGPSIGPNYAPSRFAEMTEAGGLSKAKLARAMERLFHIGAIETRQVKRRGSDTKTIIVEADPNPSELPSERLPNTRSEPFLTGSRTGPNTHRISKDISGAGPDGPQPLPGRGMVGPGTGGGPEKSEATAKQDRPPSTTNPNGAPVGSARGDT